MDGADDLWASTTGPQAMLVELPAVASVSAPRR
jgi:hypothetical protein